MFSKKHSKSIESTKLSSLIADNVHIVGDVMFSGGLRVDGKIEGNVINKGDAHGLLVLSEKGSIKGQVRVYDAVVNGSISGDLEVEHFLELQAKAHVSGNISYRQLQMECGATIEGKIERVGEGLAGAESGVTKVVDIGASHQVAGVR
ncbi:bactofilin family protein [Pseudothauera rhizosphaerae]|uniref:Polymer-forming cytoskeletal protein n=1 Tax=Pseudothauera rhizosphaerae TaxID=2565932 RepID=A0A4V3WAV9_9RHOO|nr:polymer-forming cytoskeletal protein [Pseudothauera rhizosphaerae]THF60837.1 polymer-forming cytoskeletal protein [Pseudothauera rhizosphaerae]